MSDDENFHLYTDCLHQVDASEQEKNTGMLKYI